MEYQIRQGDVFLRRVKALPPDAKRTSKKQEVILAYGEVTGHAHRLQAAYVWELARQRYVEIDQPTPLTHEEHNLYDVTTGARVETIPPGIYEITQGERNYDPSLYARRVMD